CRRWVGIARLLRFGVESFGELGDFRLGQEALDLAHRRFLDSARRIVGAQAALGGESEDRADECDALSGNALAAGGHAAGASLLAALDLLGSLAGRDGVAHPLDIGANDTIGPQFAEQGPQVLLDATVFGLQGRGLLVAHTFYELQIDQPRA